MKAMILCAGLGTRLKPWTESHPKALVPVGGVPMLKRVIGRLMEQGFTDIIVNVHHFSEQILEFIDNDPELREIVKISDESETLLDTGGGILHAQKYLGGDSEPFLVHNVDILSNADLKGLMSEHMASGRDISLLVSDRKSDRKLVFDGDMLLKGWVNSTTGLTRPADLTIAGMDRLLSFSGIYIMEPHVFTLMTRHGFDGCFPIMDFFLSGIPDLRIGGSIQDGLDMIDIGKPDSLHRANLKVQ